MCALFPRFLTICSAIWQSFNYFSDAKKASRIVNELGMREKLDMKLCAHKHEFDRQRDRLEKEMEGKNLQCHVKNVCGKLYHRDKPCY